MSRRVAIATSVDFPALDDDGPLLLAALSAAGVDARPEVWDDARVDWSSYDAVVVRSTWDYSWRLAEFLAWADATAAVTTLCNPAPVLHWNTDKRYLREIDAAGVPVVRTLWVEPADP